MRIGELARRSGLSTKALRYYESIGVLPEPDRTPAGYRDYDPGVLSILTFIRSAQAVGLTLGEIRGIVAYRDQGDPPCAHVLDLIRRRATEIDERIQELRSMREELRRLERRARTLDPDDCASDQICHVLPQG